MLLAWIIWRSADGVRRHWDEWRAENRIWRAAGDDFRRGARGPTRLDELRFDATQTLDVGTPTCSAEEAKADFYRKWGNGHTQVWAVDREGRVVELRAEQSSYLDLASSEDLLIGRHDRRMLYRGP